MYGVIILRILPWALNFSKMCLIHFKSSRKTVAHLLGKSLYFNLQSKPWRGAGGAG